MAELAGIHSTCKVTLADFQQYEFSHCKVDAILLVGSLVHLTHHELPAVLRRILLGLKQDGYLYISLKEGEGPSVKH